MKLLRKYIKKLLKEIEMKSLQSHTSEPKVGDLVVNTNPGCKHFKSVGIVKNIGELPGDIGKTVSYVSLNSGPNWKNGEIIQKTMDQLKVSK